MLERLRSSVRARITVVAVVFVLLVTGVGAVVIVLELAHTISHSLIASAKQDASAIRAQLADGVSPDQAATTGSEDVVAQLLDGRGRVIASDRPSVAHVPLRTKAGVTKTEAVPGEDDTYTVVATKGAGEVALIVVGRSTEQREETRAESAGLLAVFVPVTVLVLGLIVWFSVGRALRPVEVMREEAEQITGAHLDRRLAVPAGEDEIPRLASTLNEMLDRIDAGQRLQRQFVSDASHELRSPLAVLRQVAEVAASHPDRVGVQELAADVLTEGSRLEALVSGLLLLARLENAPVDRRELVDVDDVVGVEVARRRAAGPGADAVQIDPSGIGAGQVVGSAVLLGQLVRNLLENAVRHARTTVQVGVVEQDDDVLLTVEDDGAGIPEDQREAVFQRFVRLDEARSRDTGGSGLGLAIVRKIADGLGGSVTATGSPLGGARLEVRLPRAG